jgi:hypothetical protein
VKHIGPKTLLLTKVEQVITFTYGGMHNCPGKVREENGMVEISAWVGQMGLATWDRDDLTRLVVGAHDQCLRLAVCPSGPGMLKLRFMLRDRAANVGDAPISNGHPTIADALKAYRAKGWESE